MVTYNEQLFMLSMALQLNGMFIEDFRKRKVPTLADLQNHDNIFVETYGLDNRTELLVKVPCYHYKYSELTELKLGPIHDTTYALNITAIEDDLKETSMSIFGCNIFEEIDLKFETYPYEWLEHDTLVTQDSFRRAIFRGSK